MSRWNWMNDRPLRLENGTREDIQKDITYCKQSELIAPDELLIKAWQARRREAEAALAARFGEGDLAGRGSN